MTASTSFINEKQLATKYSNQSQQNTIIMPATGGIITLLCFITKVKVKA